MDGLFFDSDFLQDRDSEGAGLRSFGNAEVAGLALRAFGSVAFCLYNFFRIVAGALAFFAVVFRELVFVGQRDACVQQAQCQNQQFEWIESAQGKPDEKCWMYLLIPMLSLCLRVTDGSY